MIVSYIYDRDPNPEEEGRYYNWKEIGLQVSLASVGGEGQGPIYARTRHHRFGRFGEGGDSVLDGGGGEEEEEEEEHEEEKKRKGVAVKVRGGRPSSELFLRENWTIPDRMPPTYRHDFVLSSLRYAIGGGGQKYVSLSLIHSSFFFSLFSSFFSPRAHPRVSRLRSCIFPPPPPLPRC